MIKEITFEEIEYYWNTYLWSKYTNDGYIIRKVNLTTQEDYTHPAYLNIKITLVEKIIPVTYIGYFIDEKIVGVESGYKTNKDYYRVRGLWVDENHRRKGIATKLINWLESKCREKYLWTIPRESAIRFYLNYGFNITGKSAKTVYGQNYFAVKELR